MLALVTSTSRTTPIHSLSDQYQLCRLEFQKPKCSAPPPGFNSPRICLRPQHTATTSLTVLHCCLSHVHIDMPHLASHVAFAQDAKMFRRKKWKYLILDEAHMIKNWKSQRWQTLLNFNSKRRLLITGLSNNVCCRPTHAHKWRIQTFSTVKAESHVLAPGIAYNMHVCISACLTPSLMQSARVSISSGIGFVAMQSWQCMLGVFSRCGCLLDYLAVSSHTRACHSCAGRLINSRER